MNEFYAGLGLHNPYNLSKNGKLQEAIITKDNKRYYLDFKKNSYGRFLRVSRESCRGPWAQIVMRKLRSSGHLPAPGLFVVLVLCPDDLRESCKKRELLGYRRGWS